MKLFRVVHLYYFFVVLLFGCAPKEVHPTHDFVTGFFEFYDNQDRLTAYVYREGNLQQEYTISEKFRDKSTVKWVSDKEYHIINTFDIISESKDINPGTVFVIKIDSFLIDGYSFHVDLKNSQIKVSGWAKKISNTIPKEHQSKF